MSSQQSQTSPPTRSMGRNAALRDAWLAYLFLLILPFAVLAVVLVSHGSSGASPRPSHEVNRWLLLTLAYLAVGLPAAMFWRSHLCRAYFRGEVVPPHRYLAGMLTVWLTLEIGMILPIIGCHVTAAFLPGLLPAILAFLLFATLYPTGKMMISHDGSSEDPQIYREPR